MYKGAIPILLNSAFCKDIVSFLCLLIDCFAGIFWNLSSSDNLKDRLARDTLEQLTNLILTPLSASRNAAIIQQNASESEIFYNATGFLRYFNYTRIIGSERSRKILIDNSRHCCYNLLVRLVGIKREMQALLNLIQQNLFTTNVEIVNTITFISFSGN